MRMRKFGEPGQFFHVAVKEMVMLWIDPPRKPLPVKHYSLLEYYCDEPDCDCRRVVLDAVSDYGGRGFASIYFCLGNFGFFREWAGGWGLSERGARARQRGQVQ